MHNNLLDIYEKRLQLCLTATSRGFDQIDTDLIRWYEERIFILKMIKAGFKVIDYELDEPETLQV